MAGIQEFGQSSLSSATYYSKPYGNSLPKVLSYDAFPSSNYQFHINYNVLGSSFNTTKPSSNITAIESNNTAKVMTFHSSTKWKEYFEASKHSNKLIVIFFTATWCGPCRTMEPTIKELAAKFNDIEFIKLDVDELLEVSLEYGIQTMPTFLLMKNGKQMDKVVGAIKEDLHQIIERHRA